MVEKQAPHPTRLWLPVILLVTLPFLFLFIESFFWTLGNDGIDLSETFRFYFHLLGDDDNIFLPIPLAIWLILFRLTPVKLYADQHTNAAWFLILLAPMIAHQIPWIDILLHEYKGGDYVPETGLITLVAAADGLVVLLIWYFITKPLTPTPKHTSPAIVASDNKVNFSIGEISDPVNESPSSHPPASSNIDVQTTTTPPPDGDTPPAIFIWLTGFSQRCYHYIVANKKVFAFLSLGAIALSSYIYFSDTPDFYASETEGYTLSDWQDKYVTRNIYTGAILNVVPVAHLLLMIIDTLKVYSDIDDLIYGNGAIIGRSKSCPHLASPDDYELFFTWNSGHKREVIASIAQVYNQKDDIDQLSTSLGQTLNSRSIKLLEKKLEKKLAAKLGLKMMMKISINAVTGFAPILGAVAAGFINWWILSDINDHSREYFYEKAKVVCRA